MRLTLRTLLAYMDDILDPADQEELGRKIEASPFATELIHRSRDAVRRLRLSAPDVMAGGGDDLHDGGDDNLDANTAAEYLDNTLSPDEVADFERACLEAGQHADMLLAEAASCHHVLTMVLGEPAEVDADLRQRMYALLETHGQKLRIEPGHDAAARSGAQTASAAAATAVPASAVMPRSRPEDPDEAAAPDYILAAAKADRTRRRTIAAVAAAVLIGGGLTWVFWPAGKVETPREVAAMGDIDKLTEGVEVGDVEPATETAKTGDIAATEEGGQAPPFNAGESGGQAPPFAAAPSTDAAPTEPAPSDDKAAETTPPTIETPEEAATEQAETATAAAAATADAAAATPPQAPSPTDETAADIPNTTSSEGAATEGDVGDDAEMPAPETGPEATAAAADAPGPALTASNAGGIPAAPTPPGDTAAPAPGATATPAIPPQDELTTAEATDAAAASTDSSEPEQPKQLGAYLGNNDVLLRFNPQAEQWVRLPPRSALVAGDRLLSLPTFRTHVVLDDVNAYLAGGAEIALAPPEAVEDQAPVNFGLAIPYGRVVLNSGLSGNRVGLAFGDQSRIVQLGPSSSLAIEVRRVFEPGSSVVREPAPAEISWYLTSGVATWLGGVDGEVRADAPAAWTTAAGVDSEPAAIEDLPEWVDREPISDVEKRARDAVTEALTPGEPVNLRLLELSDPSERGRRTEVRALAAESGAFVGQFEPAVKALADVNQKASWKKTIELLRQAVARDPALAEAIHAAFVTQRSEEAAGELMEMLLGFDEQAIGRTRQEWQTGVLLRLIRWMDDDDLTYRILASYNMNEITGTNYLGNYRPDQTATQRTRALRHYYDRLDRGELGPKEQTAEGRRRDAAER